jgi:hypothetical protein
MQTREQNAAFYESTDCAEQDEMRAQKTVPNAPALGFPITAT